MKLDEVSNYPGDTASPEEVAWWMFLTAENEYQLPGILPVMVSCVELTDAWTAPGDVKNVTGYLWPVDGCSIGYFQQQADDLGCGTFGWGTREQLIQAPFALKRFCEEANKQRRNAVTAEELGEWCADVQRPREDLRGLYASKGYPLARKLLKDKGDGVSDKALWQIYGWYEAVNEKWDLVWHPPKQETPTEEFEWPEANAPPTAGNYEQRHPTRYTWREDVERWARYLVQNYDVSCNTYLDHPEGYGRDLDSIDVWGPGGRDYPIDTELGNTIFRMLFDDPDKPDIDWIIWRAIIYHAGNSWQGEPFGTDDFSWHYDHIHITYR